MIEKIEEKALKLVELCKEYNRSKLSLTKKYHLIKDDKQYKNYFLISLETEEIICAGDKDRLKSYMRIRNIKQEDILDFNILLT